MSPPQYRIIRIPMATAGETLLRDRIGYFHVWRFENTADGTPRLDGEIRANFGENNSEDFIPFTYNTRWQFVPPAALARLSWVAQPGIQAVIVIGADAEALDALNAPARQLVFSGQSSIAGSTQLTIGTSLVGILAPEATRTRAVIQAEPGNTSNVAIGTAGLTFGNGIILRPGESFTVQSTAAFSAISDLAGQSIRVYRELI